MSSNLEEDIQKAKSQGNDEFKNKRFEKALEFYSEAISLARKRDDPVEVQSQTCLSILLSNRAANYLSLKKGKEAKQDAEQCIQIAPNWAKGHVRVGDACTLLGELENAFQAYSKGLEIDPKNKFCVKGIETIRNLMRSNDLQNLYQRDLSYHNQQDFAKLAIRHIDDKIGKGLFTVNEIKKGDKVLIEAPLISRQFPASRKNHRLCGQCGRYLGSPKEQLDLLLQIKDKPSTDLPNWKSFYPLSPSSLSCEGCGEVYCSEKCLNVAHFLYQSFFCCLEKKEKKAWDEFKKIAEGTSERLIMAARFILLFIHRAIHIYSPSGDGLCPCPDKCPYIPFSPPSLSLSHLTETHPFLSTPLPTLPPNLPKEDRGIASFREATSLFLHCSKELWSMVLSKQLVSGERGEEEEEEGVGERYMRGVFEIKRVEKALVDCAGLLREVIGGEIVDLWSSAFESRFLDRIVGLFHQNNCTFKILHPLQQYIVNLRHAPKDLQPKLRARLNPILELVNQQFHGDVTAEGEGFFILHSCINHSCSPNIQQIAPQPRPPQPSYSSSSSSSPSLSVGKERAGIEIEALKDIEKGKELRISYITKGQSFEERQLELKTNYLFECCCVLCRKKGKN